MRAVDASRARATVPGELASIEIAHWDQLPVAGLFGTAGEVDPWARDSRQLSAGYRLTFAQRVASQSHQGHMHET
jgi:hypothetical protein